MVKKDGFIVKGYLDWQGNPYPEKAFTELSCNNKNMGAAKRYVRELEIRNKDALFKFKEQIPDELLNLDTGTNKPLPKNLKHLPDLIEYTSEDGKITGYLTVGFITLSGDTI